MIWWAALLTGAGIGLIVGMPTLVGIMKLYKRTTERLKIKKMIRNNQFLIPIDEKDYNVKVWADKIDGNNYRNNKFLLNQKIFKIDKINTDNPFEEKKSVIPTDFKAKVVEYLIKAREMGYDDNFIREQFLIKNYPNYFIEEVFKENDRANTTA